MFHEEQEEQEEHEEHEGSSDPKPWQFVQNLAVSAHFVTICCVALSWDRLTMRGGVQILRIETPPRRTGRRIAVGGVLV